MSFLDLYQDREVGFRPNEGTSLPTYYELHQGEIMISMRVGVAILVLMVIFHYRGALRAGLVATLAALLTARRKVSVIAQSFWTEVENKADGPH